jgi:outer membrane protein assembly factor BamB
MRVIPRSWAVLTGLLVLANLTVITVAAEKEVKPEAWETASWSQWRGPDRTGVSAEKNLAAGWGESGPAELWRKPLGQGFSGIVVDAGRLYTQFASGTDAFVACLSARDGSEIWRVRTGSNFKNSYGNGPRATPTLDGGVVYAMSSSGDLFAVRASDGEVVWKLDLRERYGAKPPRWGLSGSPLVEGDLLIVNPGGADGRSILALDKKTGELRWSVRDDKAGYAAPVAMTLAGVRQVLVFVGDKVVSLDPADGRTLWELGWKTDWGVNASTPILLKGDRVFLSTGYDRGAVMLKVSKSDQNVVAEELWRNREMRNKFSSSVLYEGMLYGFDEATLKCVDPEDGTTHWGERGLGHGSLFAVDGKLIVLSDKGKLVMATATSEKYEELAAAEVFETKTWTVPTLAGGRLYLRDEKEIVAFDVSK